ncbi:MAG: hypothetical protein JNK86_03060 [Alphaproteobacteria bacterium]|nr:hypothetical protein [Alphaproteobacteria bacterium]
MYQADILEVKMKLHRILRLARWGILLSFISNFSHAQTPLVTSVVTTEKLPPVGKYNLLNCGFYGSPDQQSTWWACNLYPDDFPESGTPEQMEQFHKAMIKAPALWLTPLQDNGELGRGQSVSLSLKADFNLPFSQLLTLGNDGHLLISLRSTLEQVPFIILLKLPSLVKDNNNPLQEKLFYRFFDFYYSLIQTIAMREGGYTLLLHGYDSINPPQQNNQFIVVKLNNKGQELWRYIYPKPVSEEGVPQEQMFLTADDKTVLFWANYNEYDYNQDNDNNDYGAVGTKLVCLDKNGQVINNNVVPGSSIDNPVALQNGEFGFTQYLYDKTIDRHKPYFLRFSKNCEKISQRILEFPIHPRHNSDFNNIKSILLLPNGHLLIGYIQQQYVLDAEKGATDSYNSFYLAEFDDGLKVIRDIEVIGGQNPDRDYLESITDTNGEDYIDITFALLPKRNEILVSIHNMWAGAEFASEERAPRLLPNKYLLPKIYRVQLPFSN